MTCPAPPVVTLLGAGPGDPELLTIQAVKALRRATVALVDDLVDPGVLRWLRRSARVVPVGKRGGCASTPQAFIHRLMVAEALRGERVVRIKGGDPFVFGRGGEECDALRAAGLQVQVIGGLTAGIAGPAAIGIPVTDRRHAPGVALVTGHAQDGGRGPDWTALARSGLTLVIYMGVSRLAATVQALRDGGLPASTPAAVVSAAHTPRQRQVVATLGMLESEVTRQALASPAVVVVGSVVQQAAALQEAVTLAGSGQNRRAFQPSSPPELPCPASSTTTPCPSAARRSSA
jgi:uroporphyrin-III C-methyltransferase